MRPRFQDDSFFPHVVLLINNHTSHVYRLKGSFGEAKIYWDGHHKVYELKSEVGVMASTLHYCQFVQIFNVGSVSDYAEIKDHHPTYLPYLLKTPEEIHHLQGDLQNWYWSTCEDCAYISPKEDTPDFKRLVSKKGRNLSLADLTFNEQVAKFRVSIEQFFGRVVQKWAVPRNIYRWDHKHFQMDFENFCMLTNKDIKVFICNFIFDLKFLYYFCNVKLMYKI